MRKISLVTQQVQDPALFNKADQSTCVGRLMLYDSQDGVYVFLYNSTKDSDCIGDLWFESVEEAEDFCSSDYGVEADDWRLIDDPLPDCQHDWISPVRVKGRVEGKPQWNARERLDQDGVWREFDWH